jgi:type I restriction enzyme, S subunit
MIRLEMFENIRTVLLEDSVEFLDHKRRPVTASDRRSGEYPYYGANGQQDSVDKFIFDEPLILLAEDGGHFGVPGRSIAYAVSGKCWVNNHAHVLRPRENTDLRYLLRVLENYDVSPFISGSTRGKLTKGAAEKIPIPLPPLEVQKRIASILDAADALRSKRRESLRKLEVLLKSVFLEMFGDPVTNPKGWDRRKLEEIAEIVSGVTKGRKFDGKETVEVSYMRVANVQDGHIDLDDVKTVEVLNHEVEKYALRDGDILLTEGGDPDKLGRGAIWKGSIEPCIHQNHIFRVRVKPDFVLPEFLSALIGSQHGKNYFLRAAKQTTGIASINMTQLKAFPALVPPIELQIKYRDLLNDITRKLDLSRSSSASLETLFSSLQDQAFNGTLDSAAPLLAQLEVQTSLF